MLVTFDNILIRTSSIEHALCEICIVTFVNNFFLNYWNFGEMAKLIKVVHNYSLWEITNSSQDRLAANFHNSGVRSSWCLVNIGRLLKRSSDTSPVEYLHSKVTQKTYLHSRSGEHAYWLMESYWAVGRLKKHYPWDAVSGDAGRWNFAQAKKSQVIAWTSERRCQGKLSWRTIRAANTKVLVVNSVDRRPGLLYH